MKLKVIRFSSQKDSTSGLLFDVTNGTKFLCYTLEDERREEKVMAETRIPAGVYSIILRKEGGHHARYVKKYGSMHKGMLWLQDVPNFKWIVGDSQENNVLVKDGFIGRSTQAYKRIYPPIAEAIENGESVTIEYIDLD